MSTGASKVSTHRHHEHITYLWRYKLHQNMLLPGDLKEDSEPVQLHQGAIRQVLGQDCRDKRLAQAYGIHKTTDSKRRWAYLTEYGSDAK